MVIIIIIIKTNGKRIKKENEKIYILWFIV